MQARLVPHKFFKSGGTIELNGKRYMVVQQEVFKPVVGLFEGGRNLITAKATGVFSGKLELLTADGASYRLMGTSWGRSMGLYGNGCAVEYKPLHAFTNRATIRGSWEEDLPVIFGFWLVMANWRARAAAAS
ncbi:hypothetical protein Rhal01_03731 [Rubritalea halochordaticola]|uniref:AIM24 family protein n=1 Tax=Rubritalea halochordaticola TaxID=714537 RepID=A0ABP9V4J0_9BACT